MCKLVSMLVVVVLVSLTTVACDNSDADDDKSSDMITVGIVHLGNTHTQTVDGFKAGMTEHGYVEGENITYVYDGPISALEDLDAAAAKLVEAEVDLIYCATNPAAVAVKKATEESTTPVVFGPLLDPVGAGLIDSIVVPGGHITGVYTGLTESRRMEFTTQLVPDAQNYWVLYNPDDQTSVSALEPIQAAADSWGITLSVYEAQNNDEITQALEAIPENIDVLYMVPGAWVGSRFEELMAISIARKLPLIVPVPSLVERGGLLGYGLSNAAVGKQASRLADLILKGTSPGSLPAEEAESMLGVNLVTADAIGLNINDSVLRQSNIIIRSDAE